MRIVTTIRESGTYRWAASSVVVSVLSDERVLKGLVGVIVVVSVVSVVISNIGVGIKFLSVLLLFAVLRSATKR